MSDDFGFLDIKNIGDSYKITGLGQNKKEQQKKRQNKQSEDNKKNPLQYIKTLQKAAEASNQKLINLNLPYRFCVYNDNTKLIIEIVMLDKEGKIIQNKKKNISEQDFSRLIEDLSQIEGLFFDEFV
jgi:ribosomal protein L15E